MRRFSEILEQIKKERASISTKAQDKHAESLEALRDTLRAYHNGTATEADRAKAKAAEAETLASVKREQDRNTAHRLAAEILKDNAKQAFYFEYISKICEIWNAYAGKPHGEKTAAKIREELHAATGYRVYIGNKYGGANITIYTDRAPVDNFEIGNKSGEQSAALDSDNKIIPLDPSALRVWYCGEYVENVTAHIKQLKKKHAEARRAFEKLQDIASSYNEIKRGNISHINAREGVKNYLI